MNKHQHPEVFHKTKYNKHYFEGWYYKQVTADGRHTISFIPGVSFEKGERKSFIQCIHLDGQQVLNTYPIDYTIDVFKTTDHPFSVYIDQNKFTLEEIRLAIQSEQLNVQGNIKFGRLTPLDTTLFSPNIMGWFSYIPFMECNHGIMSMGHELDGRLTINGECIDFTGGKGYIEKDWGRSFPKHYMWIQSNHFDEASTAFFCAVAHIPFLAFSFTGFICNLVHQGVEYRFATYNGTRILVNHQSKKSVHLVFKNNKYRLEIRGKTEMTKNLFAPKKGAMNHMIKEGLSGKVHIILHDIKGHCILDTYSEQCGMELVDRLMTQSE